MTSLFKPMLAYSKTPDLETLEYPLLASPKLDGIRCVMVNHAACTRSLKHIPNRHIQNTLAKYKLHGLDGEIMVKGDFNSVQSAVMSVDGTPEFTFNVFDDFALSSGMFTDRLANATRTINLLSVPYINIVKHVLVENAKDLQVYWDWCIQQGYEGAMVRKLTGPYKHGRSTMNEGYLIKLKSWTDTEGIITGFVEQQSNTNEAFKGELGQTKRSHEQAGMVGTDTLGTLLLSWRGKTVKVGSGFGGGVPGVDAELRQTIWDNRKHYINKTVTFKYQELSKYGVPRFAIFKGFRDVRDQSPS